MEIKELLLNYIRHCFSNIRGDWSDPRYDCREGWEAVDRLAIEMGFKIGSYKNNEKETDEQYYTRIEKELTKE